MKRMQSLTTPKSPQVVTAKLRSRQCISMLKGGCCLPRPFPTQTCVRAQRPHMRATMQRGTPARAITQRDPIPPAKPT